MSDSPEIVVHRARRFITIDARCPDAEAVAVRGERIVAVGSLAEVLRIVGDVPHRIDDRLADKVVLPGFIEQHLHPLLGAATLTTAVIATEDWELPDVTFPAARDADDYWRLLRAAEAVCAPGEWLFSWGYHSLWHGKMHRSMLDEVSATRPIAVWQRSCHEFHLNTAAIEALGITADGVAASGRAGTMVDLEAGHWWETGTLVHLLPRIAPHFLTRARFELGLRRMVAYLHANGVTALNEPGISWGTEPWDLYQEILGADTTPLWSTFLVDGRLQADSGMDPAAAVADAERQVAIAPAGKVQLFDKQVKLFADGAIISQLMQMRDPYLDAHGRPDPDHHGEWMMEPETLEVFFRTYWEAGWQVHVHVNGDHGLDVLLDVIERCMRDHPRVDHRTVIVHFANSTEEQIDRIARVGAIVSANPYYPCGFADRYGEFGLGPARADVMVRSASVLGRSVPLSFHSDLPMAPADPLALASYGVNRRTQSGRIAAPEQRIGVLDALRAVTIEAAYSWRREHEIGSISPGKYATFTVLDDDPFEVDPEELDRLGVVGTVFRGTWFPTESPRRQRRADAGPAPASAGGARLFAVAAPGREAGCDHGQGGAHSCSCGVARVLAAFVPRRVA